MQEPGKGEKVVAEEKNTTNEPIDESQLVKVRREKLAALQAAGRDPFKITTFDQTHHSTEIKEHFDELGGKMDADGNYTEEPVTVRIAGRMMNKRVMGKASFCNVLDRYGNIQVYVSRNDLGDESYADFKRLDIGDIIGVEGFPFKTKTGEITVHAKKMTLLSKSLYPLPEKYHGLQNTDTRYRQRYLDLIMNQGSREVFYKRSAIIREIRNFLAARDFIAFITHYNALDEDKKLRISLELYLKRLIVGGMERVFEIGRVFRNEGLDQRHNPEFTLMELYQAYTDYNGMMELTESMFRDLAQKVCGTTTIYYGNKEDGTGHEIDLGKPFRRLTMVEAIREETGIDFDAIKTDEEAKQLAKEHNIEFEERHKKGDIVNLFFDEYCEDKMIQPTFIMDHPIEISPLTKKKPDDPSKVERFELYINGWEMCNAYSELNDPIDQRGMPPTGGIGYGIDRLVMLLTNSEAIRDVLLFPTMKSIKE